MDKRVKIEKIYNLSPMQEGILFHSLLESNSSAYFEQMEVSLDGKVDVEIIEKSFNLLVERHDILRTNFVHQKVKNPQQVVFNEREVKINYEDISNFSYKDKLDYIENFKEQDRKKGFNLTKDILIRISVVKLGRENYKLIWSFHHIILDGWSLGIIISEFFNIYKSLVNKRDIELNIAPLYGNYIKWLNSQNREEGLNYWTNYLQGIEDKAVIPKLSNKKFNVEYNEKELEFIFEKETLENLNKIALKNGVTISTIFQAMWGILLQRYNNTNDVVFGSVISGRPAEVRGIERTVGLFINTIPVRVKGGQIPFSKLIKDIQQAMIMAEKYNYFPLYEIQNDTVLKSELLGHIMAFENYPIEKQKESLNCDKTLGFSIMHMEMFERTNYDFNVIVQPGSSLKVFFRFNGNVYDDNFIKGIEGHLKEIARNVIENTDIIVDDIDILTDKEKQLLIYDLNDTDSYFPKEKTISQLFEEQVKKSPNSIAVEFENQELTYNELNEKANSLARVLREKGVTRDCIVGLMVERSFEMIIGIIAILKAGGAYLPIDSDYPKERIYYMLQDSDVKIMLTQNKLINQLEIENKFNIETDFNIEIIDLENDKIYKKCVDNLSNINTSNDLSYVIYTSGSTGKSKGNLVMHYNVNRVVKNTNYIDLLQEDRILQLSNYAFDGSVFDIYGALLNGSKLILINKDKILDINKLADEIVTKNITVLFITTALFNTLVDNRIGCFKNIRKVLFGGEKISVLHAKKALDYVEKNKIIHVYGPTESTVFTTYYCINEINEYDQNIPIGSPISNTYTYIMGKNNKISPIGVEGEICISGAGIVKGYLNNKDLTNEKFIINPFIKGEKLYKSGDLGRMLPNGNIEFVKRLDNQIKIRGFRIEMGEIEKNLLTYKDVKEVVVIDIEDNDENKYLCAYIISDIQLNINELRIYLKSKLPKYMIPSYFMQIDKMPLTTNGKIDKRTLPNPKGNIINLDEYEAPTSKLEEKLVAIWNEVLETKNIGINNNFFELGGHSLKATSLCSKIYKELNMDVPIKEIFKSPTIKEIAKYILSKENSVHEGINKIDEKEYYEASSAQKRMYMLQQFDLKGTGYNIPHILEIKGDIDISKLETVFCKLINRHEALRTSFKNIDGEIVQIVSDDVNFKIDYKDLSVMMQQFHTDENELDFSYKISEKIERILGSSIKAFDLTNPPLLRVYVIKIEEAKHLIMLDMHHIISDGVSISILTNEFIKLYNGNSLEELRLQYKDFSAWQNSFFKSDRIKKQEQYWLEKFSREIPVLNMPTDFSRPLVQSFEGNTINFKLDKELTSELKKISKETGSTMYMILLSAINILLSKYSKQEDIVIGSPIAGRLHSDLEKIVGMFVNTLAMRNYPKKSKSYKEFLKEVKENALIAYENQDYQFEELVNKLNLRRDVSRNPIFDVMFTMQNMNLSEIKLENLKFTPYKMASKIAKFDLTFTAIEIDEELLMSIEYCTKLFKQETIERMVVHYKNIIGTITNNMEINLEEIEILSKEEKNKLLYEFNNSYIGYPKDKTVHQLFEEQVEKTPDNIAIVFEDKKLTYRELNEKANKLARTLRKKGVQQDSIVGIITKRSLEMVIGIIGTLKAGGAYLPIDPEYPKDRINYMIEDSKVNILLTQGIFINKLVFGGEIIILENEKEYSENVQNLKNINIGKNLAYVIYTSGSTGKPKGVMIEHKSISQTLQWRKNEYELGSNHSILNLFSNAFDGFVTSFFTSIISGAKVVLLNDEDSKDVSKINENIKKYEITHFIAVPSLCLVIMESISIKEVQTLKVITLAGEALTQNVIEKCKSVKADIEIVNEYGPTENSVVTTILRNVLIDKPITIGKPKDNTKVYILDKVNNLQPIGIVGEICISGIGLARGYLNNEKLTAEKFIENPYEIGKKMYRTGDLGRWLPDGNIEFIGRIDHQVKIRGFRIELGEIENQILAYKKIKEVVVIDIEDKNEEKYLCAYLVSDEKVIVDELRTHLSKILPKYMVPSYFMQLEKIPLTHNGKVDRKALLNLNIRTTINVEYEAPRDEVEEKLIKIWSEMLGKEDIGINHNFFELGGHSLKATSLISKIHKQLNVEIPFKEIFKLPTIKEISEYIQKTEKNVYEEIKILEEREYYEASSAQKRIYMLQQFDLENTSYNMPGILEIEGNLDIKRLESAFNKLIERHETLRTFFENIDGEIVQKIKSNVDFKVDYVDIAKTIEEVASDKKITGLGNKQDKIVICSEVEKLINNFVKPFDLNEAPLLRVGVIRTHKIKHILMFDMHHIISDGVSMGILTKEFADLYEERNLEKIKTQYKDFSEWQNKFLKSEKMKKQEEYWLQRFNDEMPVLNIPIDFVRPLVQSFEGDNINFKLDKKLTSDLNEIVKKTRSTMYMVLLSGINILLSKYSGQEDIVVGSVIAGRSHVDLEKIIGMFVNTLVLRNYPKKNMSYEEFLNEVKENSLKAYENQDYQFEELVKKLNTKRDISRNPIFDVMFTMQNMNPTEIELKDLKFIPYKNSNKVAKFDLTFTAYEVGDEIFIDISYCTKLFKQATIERIIEHFKNILKAITKNTSIKLSEIEMISEYEKNKLLYELNNTYTDYPKDKTIHQLFEEQVEKTPNNVALVFQNVKLTYRELNEKANKLALMLREKGVKQESIVGIMIERCPEMIIGIIGILKAGGAYLAISPQYPNDRIKYMLHDCKSNILLTESAFINKLVFDGEIINLKNEKEYKDNTENIVNISEAKNLAYIIYTSGSTGQPKGVMIEHKNVTNVLTWFKKEYNVNSKTNIINLTEYTFDPSIEQIFGALVSGATLYLPTKKEIMDIENLERYIRVNKINMINCVPTIIKELIGNNKKIDTLDIIIAGGEKLENNLKDKIIKNGYKLVNHYGPTETTIDVLCYLCKESEKVVIGKPISNTNVYILDKNNNIMPIGIPGELCISGVGVSRGYINKPELTSEKFIKNPFIHGQKMYRTGDLARWLPNGDIEFLGRIDHQVKIRGLRIELEEIENQLLIYKSIKETIVIDREDKKGNKYLCAYIVCNKEISVGELREHLLKTLPDYMIPSYFMQLEKIPLTNSGKIDRSALPEPDGNIVTGTEYEAPRNKIEKKLTNIWMEILEINKVSINDNFFELGGHSLKCIILTKKIYKELNVELSLKDFYKNPTIKNISENIKNIAKQKVVQLNNSTMLLNSETGKNIFAFPPISGFGIAFNELAKQLNEYSIYSFDFIEEEDRIEKYVKLIKNIQDNGPYILIGYSAGGNLAFEVGKALEVEGCIVSDIIMFDSIPVYVREKIDIDTNMEMMLEEVEKYLEAEVPYMIEYVKEDIFNKMKKYMELLKEDINKETIQSNIHIITSESNKNSDCYISWNKITKGKVEIYNGIGKHNDMLNTYCIMQNGNILNDILDNICTYK